jgi:hypothetical protein
VAEPQVHTKSNLTTLRLWLRPGQYGKSALRGDVSLLVCEIAQSSSFLRKVTHTLYHPRVISETAVESGHTLKRPRRRRL